MGEDLGLRIEATNILAVQILNMTRLAVTSDRTETFEEQFQKVRKEVAARHPENESTVDWAIEVIRRDAFVRGREPDKA